jgi:tRNA A-37 threonylcarbamoyl transferase component Bud32
VEEACARFKASWQTRQPGQSPPRIEDYLAEVPAPARAILLQALLVLELVYRRQAGDRPGPEEYLARFPQDREVIQAAFGDLTVSTPPAVADSVRQAETLSVSPEPRRAHRSDPDLPVFIDKYRVVERLGRGGQAEVFRAVHSGLPGRDVVVKWARRELTPGAQQQILAEGRVLTQLDDPGLARVYDVGICDGRPFVVMEYVPGRNLRQRLREGPLPPREAAGIVARLAATLERVHRLGACHRDLKPDNVLLDPAGNPRLVDFGLALVDRPWELAERRAGDVSGTFQYMAPEQAAGEAERIGPRTDVFGLGGILYAILTGKAPYEGSDVTPVLEQARRGGVVPARRLNPAVPRALERICMKALAPAPEQRYATAAALSQALRAYLRRGRVVGAVTGLAALVGVGLLVAILGRSRVEPSPNPPPVAARPAAITSFDIRHYRGDRLLGTIGLQSYAARLGDRVYLRAALREPGYCFLIALNPDGKEELLYPEDPATAPPPSAGVPDADAKADPIQFNLDDGVGQQAFVLVASAKPLPAYKAWRTQLGPAPWPAGQAEPAWQSEGGPPEPMQTVRGAAGRQREPAAPLVRWLRSLSEAGQAEAVRVLAFPVLGKDAPGGEQGKP